MSILLDAYAWGRGCRSHATELLVCDDMCCEGVYSMFNCCPVLVRGLVGEVVAKFMDLRFPEFFAAFDVAFLML